MATQGTGVVVKGLAEFRAAVRASAAKMPPQLAAGLKKAGIPILAQLRGVAPGRVGTAPTTRVRGARADIVSTLPFQGGAEWGQFGKWAGWVQKYGPPPRFVYPSVEAKADEAGQIIMNELRSILEIQGWAHI